MLSSCYDYTPYNRKKKNHNNTENCEEHPPTHAPTHPTCIFASRKSGRRQLSPEQIATTLCKSRKRIRNRRKISYKNAKEDRVKFHESTQREKQKHNPIEPFLFQFGGVADLRLRLMGYRIILYHLRRLPLL